MNASMGRPVADLDDYLEAAPLPVLRAADEPAPVAAKGRSRALWWIMGAATVLVAAGLTFWLVTKSQPAAAGNSAPTVTAVSTPPGVGGFAELYVAAFLSGTPNATDDFLPAAPSTEAMTPAAHYATRTAALDITEVDDRYWAVVVAADVLTFIDGGYQPSGLQYFQIGVVDDGGRLVATTLPARVSAPPPRQGAPRFLQQATETPSDAQAALVGDFLETLLIGSRDINRYVSPASGITAISPAPYVAISVGSLGLYGDGVVIATLDAQEADGAIVAMQYVVRITDSGSGLVVSELLPGPPAITSSAGDGQ